MTRTPPFHVRSPPPTRVMNKADDKSSHAASAFCAGCGSMVWDFWPAPGCLFSSNLWGSNPRSVRSRFSSSSFTYTNVKLSLKHLRFHDPQRAFTLASFWRLSKALPAWLSLLSSYYRPTPVAQLGVVSHHKKATQLVWILPRFSPVDPTIRGLPDLLIQAKQVIILATFNCFLSVNDSSVDVIFSPGVVT